MESGLRSGLQILFRSILAYSPQQLIYKLSHSSLSTNNNENNSHQYLSNGEETRFAKLSCHLSKSH